MALLLLFTSFLIQANASPVNPQIPLREASLNTVKEDLRLILREAHLSSNFLKIYQTKVSKGNKVIIDCSQENEIRLMVGATQNEWSSTFYKGLRYLGFLFPHPRIQVSPTENQIRSHCGETVVWKPRFSYRGFHMHTQHPSEWVHGFLMGDQKIGMDMIRWSARNGQNLIQVVLLRQPKFEKIISSLRPLFNFAHQFGIYTGVSGSFALQQQRSLRLLTPFQSLTGIGAEKQIFLQLQNWIKQIDFDFLTLEIGTSELTSTNEERTLKWMNLAAKKLSRAGRQLWIKVHVSSNQRSKNYGNFNFLPQYADSEVGILPHTVMFYGLNDLYTPMYGRKNFKDLHHFMKEEVKKRPTWYFPETSYFIAMDIDVPLFLTDYLKSRSDDFDQIESDGVKGVLTFTTGQELGYWLFDWTTALLIDSDYKKDEKIALKLLGEDLKVWGKILEFQSKFFKKKQLISMISSTNLFDELPLIGSPIHERRLLKELSKNPILAGVQAAQLEVALDALPKTKEIKNLELRALMNMTFLRLSHSYFLRKALTYGKHTQKRAFLLNKAKQKRMKGLRLMSKIISRFNRYPEAYVFEEHKNPTSYAWGYGWPAATLHYWKREEEMIRRNIYRPTFMNIFEALPFLFSY